MNKLKLGTFGSALNGIVLLLARIKYALFRCEFAASCMLYDERSVNCNEMLGRDCGKRKKLENK